MADYARHCRGFSLIEVLVAFLVLSMALGVLLNINSLAMRSTRTAEAHQHALQLAESKLAELVAEPVLERGRQQGTFAGGYEWRTEVEEFAFPQASAATVYSVMPYRVAVTVTWGERAAQKIKLTSVRLVTEPSL